MKKEDLIKSVKDVFTIGNVRNFIIPNYQRGYKWNRGNVQKLLDDLSTFQKAHPAFEDDSFYCLQNITIIPSSDGKSFHIVDGQQRLTTLYIILSYFRRFHPSEYLNFFSKASCLKYDVRIETGKFLETDVFSGIIWDNPINPEEQSRKDQYFIADVAFGVHDWFTKSSNTLSVNTIVNKLKLIVNNMENQKVTEEEIFSGLNGGKVELDGADLVRAELITRSSKERFNDEKSSQSAKVREFRQRIALELDEMNQWWSRKEQITYFEQFLPSDFNNNIFNHNIHRIGLLYKLYYEIYRSENEKLGIEFFENGRDLNNTPGDNHWELYNSLINLHQTLQLWFNDTQLYHWVGYLIFSFKQSTSVRDIWNMWEESSTKEEFLIKIINSIKTKFIVDKDIYPINKLIEDICDTKNQWYGKRSADITRILVLMDVMKCTGFYIDCWKQEDKSKMKKIKSLMEIPFTSQRLRADYFQKCSEDFEHVRSCAPNEEEGKEEKNKMEWLNHINNTYSSAAETSEEYKMKCELLNILNAHESNVLDDAIITKLNDVMNKYGQHSLGNLVLLNSGVNRSYKNASFQEKIQRIFAEFIQGNTYIRPYTMLVFERKIADSDKSWRWTHTNIRENVRNIAFNVENFFNIEL